MHFLQPTGVLAATVVINGGADRGPERAGRRQYRTAAQSGEARGDDGGSGGLPVGGEAAEVERDSVDARLWDSLHRSRRVERASSAWGVEQGARAVLEHWTPDEITRWPPPRRRPCAR